MVTSSSRDSATSTKIWLTVLVCGLGYFVDIYDLILFNIVRKESLLAIGVLTENIEAASSLIITSQMIGMLLGGLLFGILADKKGRLSVMLGSILVYSAMNIANAFVTSVDMYAILRFVSGIGLAGELGVAITLVSEAMPKKTRGFGTTFVASLGILGAVGAYLVHANYDWRTAYVVGGVMGFLLLTLRVGIGESGMFKAAKSSHASRGNFFMLLKPKRVVRYLSSIAIGLPVWYVIGVLVSFAPDLAKELGSTEVITAGACVMWAYVGLAVGDVASGLLSQLFKSRKKSIILFIGLSCAAVVWYLLTPNKTATMAYTQCGILGFAVGYWAVFVTTAAEQFGTNLRATVATTAPNFVRGALALMLSWYTALKVDMSRVSAASIIGMAVMILAVAGWFFLKETYNQDLDYTEAD